MILQARDVDVDRAEWINARRRDQEGEWEFNDSNPVRIWDTVEEHWTEPLAPDVVQQAYLRLVHNRCSACRFTDNFNGAVEKHIEQIANGVKEHRGAKLIPFTEGEYSGTTCTACGGRFLLRKRQGEAHLERFNEDTVRAHRGAREVRIRRYTLEPPVLTLPVKVGPDDIQEQRRPRLPTGRRRRGHRGGRRHG